MCFRLNGCLKLQQVSRIENLYQAAKFAIETAIPHGSWVSIIEFDNLTNILSQFVEINNASRRSLVTLLPKNTGGTTCIPCGLDEAISVRQYHLNRNMEERYLLIYPTIKD